MYEPHSNRCKHSLAPWCVCIIARAYALRCARSCEIVGTTDGGVAFARSGDLVAIASMIKRYIKQHTRWSNGCCGSGVGDCANRQHLEYQREKDRERDVIYGATFSVEVYVRVSRLAEGGVTFENNKARPNAKNTRHRYIGDDQTTQLDQKWRQHQRRRHSVENASSLSGTRLTIC